MLLRKIIFLIFIIAFLSYAFFAARGVLFSPYLEIFVPEDGTKTSSSRVNVSGKTIPNTSVRVGGSYLQSDGNGFFKGFLTFHPGYNEMGISVKNRFDRETRKVIRFVND